MSTYKRVGTSNVKPQFNEEEGEAVSAELKNRDTNKNIYFGIKKSKNDSDSVKPWRVLTDADFSIQITSDTDGCSATITKNTSDSTNKTGIITYSLSKNSTGSQRLITFKYKNTELFKILQDPASTDNNTYVYLRFWRGYEYQLSSINSYRIATTGDLDEYTFNDTLQLDEFKCVIYEWNNGGGQYDGNILYHVTNNKDITNIFTYNIRINQLVNLGILTYVSGKNFNTDTRMVIESPLKMCKTNTTQEDVKDDSTMHMYVCQFNEERDLYYATPMTNELYNKVTWNNITDGDETSIGKYLYTPKNKVKKGTIYIIACKGDFISYIFNSNIGNSFTSTNNYDSFYFQSLQNGYFIFYYSNENITINDKCVLDLLKNGTLVYKDGKTDLSKLAESNATYNPTLYADAKAPATINVHNSTSKVSLTLSTKLYIYYKIQNSNEYRISNINGVSFSDITNNYNWGAYDYYEYE